METSSRRSPIQYSGSIYVISGSQAPHFVGACSTSTSRSALKPLRWSSQRQYGLHPNGTNPSSLPPPWKSRTPNCSLLPRTTPPSPASNDGAPRDDHHVLLVQGQRRPVDGLGERGHTAVAVGLPDAGHRL